MRLMRAPFPGVTKRHVGAALGIVAILAGAMADAFAQERLRRRTRSVVDDINSGVINPNGLLPGVNSAMPFAPVPPTIAPVMPGIPSQTPHAALPRTPDGKVPLALSARYAKDGATVQTGVVWRVFSDKPEPNGTFALVGETREAAPVFALNPGGYVVHVTYGTVVMTRRIAVNTEAVRENFVINAGGLKLAAAIGKTPIPAQQITFDIYQGGLFTGQDQKLYLRNAPAGELLLVPEGTYNIVSTYGDTNATVRADITIKAGKLIDATLNHRAATITLKLVATKGGEPLPNTAWTILTPGGDTIKESIGAFPSIILAEGEYIAQARNEGKLFRQTFMVETGRDRDVEVIAREAPGARK